MAMMAMSAPTSIARKVDGVYSADPKVDGNAKKFETLGFDEVIEGKLGVMDTNAIVLCRD